MARLRDYYIKEVVPSLVKEFNYKNRMQVPKLDKIVVNMGVGEAIQNIKALESAVADLSMIVGQKPVITKAKKSIATFKLRQGMSIGCRVTLRGDRMYEFFDRLVNIALPRVRDFRGISQKSFDGRGNFATGLKEQIIFPEIDYDKIDKIRGMNIVIATTARTDEEARQLLRFMGLPFRKKSLIAKAKRSPKFSVRAYNRCPICGRPRAYFRKFDMCRICLRNRALKGEIPGLIKSSW